MKFFGLFSLRAKILILDKKCTEKGLRSVKSGVERGIHEEIVMITVSVEKTSQFLLI